MEELLNKLIRKGWKPFGVDGDNKKCIITYHKPIVDNQYFVVSYFRDDIGRIGGRQFCKRELVSKESGLWQFVCENGMVKMKEGFYWQNIFHLDSKEYDYTDYQYWILESSLIDEDELEDFLIENINI